MALTSAEIEQRFPVWEALSELFVDTALDENGLRSIARTLRAAGYPVATLESILRDEVLPVFCSNLLSMAGNWTGWPGELIKDLVLRHLARDAEALMPRSIKIACRTLKLRSVRSDWSRIVSLLSHSERSLSPIVRLDSSGERR